MVLRQDVRSYSVSACDGVFSTEPPFLTVAANTATITRPGGNDTYRIRKRFSKLVLGAPEGPLAVSSPVRGGFGIVEPGRFSITHGDSRWDLTVDAKAEEQTSTLEQDGRTAATIDIVYHHEIGPRERQRGFFSSDMRSHHAWITGTLTVNIDVPPPVLVLAVRQTLTPFWFARPTGSWSQQAQSAQSRSSHLGGGGFDGGNGGGD